MNLQQAVDFVSHLRPGEKCVIHPMELNFPGYEYNGARFTPADCVLEKIVGSSYEFSWRNHLYNREIQFERLKKPLPSESRLRTYVSPDRLDYFRMRTDGLYELIEKQEH